MIVFVVLPVRTHKPVAVGPSVGENAHPLTLPAIPFALGVRKVHVIPSGLVDTVPDAPPARIIVPFHAIQKHDDVKLEARAVHIIPFVLVAIIAVPVPPATNKFSAPPIQITTKPVVNTVVPVRPTHVVPPIDVAIQWFPLFPTIVHKFSNGLQATERAVASTPVVPIEPQLIPSGLDKNVFTPVPVATN